jgi:hypothetical protein
MKLHGQRIVITSNRKERKQTETETERGVKRKRKMSGYLNLKLSTRLCSNAMAKGIKRSSWRDMILIQKAEREK